MEEKRIMHYSSHHKILLVGEGDFSFSLCLAKAFGSASNIVATSLYCEVSLKLYHSRSNSNLRELAKLGCTVLHYVDAHTMYQHPLLQTLCFDRIVFNFPHAGFLYSENKPRQIKLHQNLVLGFLKSARSMLSHDGEIHVTHKNSGPFSKWEVVKLADEAGLLLVEEVPFHLCDYPGYINKRGSGSNSDGTFHVGRCSTYKFSKDHVDYASLLLEMVDLDV